MSVKCTNIGPNTVTSLRCRLIITAHTQGKRGGRGGGGGGKARWEQMNKSKTTGARKEEGGEKNRHKKAGEHRNSCQKARAASDKAETIVC